MEYRVVTDRDMVVDYLGVFEKDTPRTFTESDAAWFQRARGVPLLQSNVPDGVDVTIVVSSKEG